MGTHSWIAGLLDFERDGDVFIAPQWSGPGTRLFGGLIAAQSLGAAGATVDPDKRPQSLHAYFVRGGRHGVDVELQVERTRDGRSFDTRRVTARQEGKVILEMIASFHIDEPGADWFPPRAPSVELIDAVAKNPDLDVVDRFELRCNPDDDSPFAVPPFWIRTRDPIEDDPLIRACTLTYMSDLGPVPAARRRAPRSAKTSATPPASITRCGSTGRSSPIPGIATRSTHWATAILADSSSAGCTTHPDRSSPTPANRLFGACEP